MTPSPHLLKAVRESRLDISQEYIALCSELDFRKKIKLSFKQHPFLWLGGAAGAGLLSTFFGMKPAAKRGTSIPHAASTAGTFSKVGWLAGALEIGKLLYPILRPVLLEFANKTVQSSLSKKSRPQ